MKRFFKKPSRDRKVRPILMAKIVEMRSPKGGVLKTEKVLTTQKAKKTSKVVENNVDASAKATTLKTEEKKSKKASTILSECLKNEVETKQNVIVSSAVVATDDPHLET